VNIKTLDSCLWLGSA